MGEFFIAILGSVIADVISSYIRKWLNREER